MNAFKNRTLQISKFPDDNNIFEEADEDLNEHTVRSNELLEDLFLKNQQTNKSVSDPFHKDFLNTTKFTMSGNISNLFNMT